MKAFSMCLLSLLLLTQSSHALSQPDSLIPVTFVRLVSTNSAEMEFPDGTIVTVRFIGLKNVPPMEGFLNDQPSETFDILTRCLFSNLNEIDELYFEYEQPPSSENFSLAGWLWFRVDNEYWLLNTEIQRDFAGYNYPYHLSVTEVQAFQGTKHFDRLEETALLQFPPMLLPPENDGNIHDPITVVFPAVNVNMESDPLSEPPSDELRVVFRGPHEQTRDLWRLIFQIVGRNPSTQEVKLTVRLLKNDQILIRNGQRVEFTTTSVVESGDRLSVLIDKATYALSDRIKWIYEFNEPE